MLGSLSSARKRIRRLTSVGTKSRAPLKAGSQRLLRFEPLEDRQTPAIAASFSGGFSLAAGAPVNVSKLTLDQNQPNIAQDPTNPARMFAISSATSGGLFGAYSTNAGQTWTTRSVATGADGLATGLGDAQLAWDNYGNLFLAYIRSGTNATVVGLSTDGGQSFVAKLDTGSANDQPSLAVGNGMVVVAFNRAGTMRSYSASVSGLGVMGSFGFEQSVAGLGNFGNIAIGPAGQVMMTWTQALGNQNAENIYCAVDSDGLGFGGYGTTYTVTSTNVGSADAIPAQAVRKIDSEPNVAFDSLGRAYLAYTDESPNESSNTDIYVRTSDDNGATWSAAVKVNNDATTKSQFLPSIAVDRDTGFVAVSWYDARNSAGNNTTQIYGSVSVDRGATFLSNLQIGPGVSNSASSPSALDFGDYAGLSFVGGSFYPVWADNSNSTGDNPAGSLASFDVYTARARVQSVGGLTVTLNGTSGADAFGIKTDPTGTYVLFFENNPAMTGKPSFVATKASLAKIVVSAGDGDDTLMLDFNSGSPIPTNPIEFYDNVGINTLKAVGNTDFSLTDFNLYVGATPAVNFFGVTQAYLTGGAGANSLWAGGWSGAVYMDGLGGSDTYTANVYYIAGQFHCFDSGATGADVVKITGTSGLVTSVYADHVEAGFSNQVNYGGVERLQVSADGNLDVIHVRSTSVATNIVGAQNTFVHVGDATGVQNILAVVNIENPSGFNTVTINNGADAVGRSVSMSNMGANPSDVAGSNGDWGVISGLGPANINYQYADTLTIDVNFGSGADTLYYLGSNMLLNFTTTVNGGNGADQFAIYGNNYGTGGIININGQAGNDSYFTFSTVSAGPILTLNGGADSDKLFGHSGLANWYITNVGGSYVDFSTNTSMAYSGMEFLLASAIQSNFRVYSTAAGTKLCIVAGASNSYVILGQNGSTQDILGDVNIENPNGYSNVVINDDGSSASRSVTINNFYGNPDSYAGFNNIWNKIAGLAPASINVNDQDTSSITINGGAGADTYNVSPGVLTPIIVNAGAPLFPSLVVADTLNLNLAGTNSQLFTPMGNGGGKWELGNYASVQFTGFERMTPGVSISGRVYNDLNNNGNDDGGAEPGMPGVLVNIDPLAGGNLSLQAVTAADGSYSFADLGNCTYRVRQIVPGGYVQSSVNPADLANSSPLVNSGINFGNHSSAVDAIAPTVAGVYFDGSTWAGSFRAAVGNGAYGRPAQGGAAQLTALPWSNINTVYVKFSEHVALDIADLAVRGINVPNYPILNFSYDSVNFVAKFTIAANLDTDRLILDLDGDSNNGVKDAAGNKLAGNWTEGVSTFPTTGSAGVDFRYRFVVAVGDVNQNAQVRNADLNLVRNNLFIDVGQAGYNAFADIDGNGLTRNADLNAVRNHLFIDPPAGPGPNNAQRGQAISREKTQASRAPRYSFRALDAVVEGRTPRRPGEALYASLLDEMFAAVEF